ncbi:alpha/beta fold hydrolase [Streptomyces griseomycini]
MRCHRRPAVVGPPAPATARGASPAEGGTAATVTGTHSQGAPSGSAPVSGRRWSCPSPGAAGYSPVMPQRRVSPPHVGHDRAGRAMVRGLGTPRLDEPNTPVVLVPGPGAPGCLLRTPERLAQSGPVRLLGVPGSGDPSGPACPETLGPLADTVARWLATVPPGPVVLAGHSTGARVALHAAVRVPGRVRALVLPAPHVPAPPAAVAATARRAHPYGRP